MTDARILAAALAAAAFASACSAQVDASSGAKADPAAAAPAAAATAAAAPSADSARIWVVRLYDRYRDDSFSPFGDTSDVFAPEILEALAENDRLTPEGEQGAIDADPICSCQDPTDMQATVREVKLNGADRATVKVKLQWPLPPDPIPSQIPDYTQQVTLQLVMTPGGWRVRDIGSAEMRASFLGYLKEFNAEARTQR